MSKSSKERKDKPEMEEDDYGDYEEFDLLERLETLREDMEDLGVTTLAGVIEHIEALHYRACVPLYSLVVYSPPR